MSMRIVPCVALAATLATLATSPAGAQAPEAQSAATDQPLSLDAAISLRSHNPLSPVTCSPDGAWIAHTVTTPETVQRGRNSFFSESGTPLSWGNARMEAVVSPTGGGTTLVIGGPAASSWSPTWSPSGQHVAFYSDQGGEAGLWIWERARATARRVPGVIARPAWGVEVPQWSPSGDRVLVKLVPAGFTLSEANARGALGAQEGPSGSDRDAPSVVVRQSPSPQPVAVQPTQVAAETRELVALTPLLDARRADLAILDVATGQVDRIVTDAHVFSYAFSPDGRSMAYTELVGADPVTHQGIFDLHVLDLATGKGAVVGMRLALASGSAWVWSPEGGRIAFTTADGDDPAGGRVLSGSIGVVSVSGDAHAPFKEMPRATGAEARAVPHWSADGRYLYRVLGGDIWGVDVHTGAAQRVAGIAGARIRSIAIASGGRPAATSAGVADTLWVIATDTSGEHTGLYRVEPQAGTVRPRLREERRYLGGLSHVHCRATDAVIVVTSAPGRLNELWVHDGATEGLHQASQINAQLLSVRLGASRTLQWRRQDGRELGGSLLLPPGYVGDKPLPLVTWVYAGGNASSPNWFGLVGNSAMFNMHILATRGFAVFVPEIPYGTGRLAEDVAASVLSGVDAAISAGIADPERLALMGQSFGSLNVLQLLTRTERFKAAVISAAVAHPDLFAAYLGDALYYERGQGNMGGTIWEFPERYRANSPIFDFPRITTPLLILQGTSDRDLGPSSAIFTALERLGKRVELRSYAGEGHVISGSAHIRDAWERRLAFLAEHLELHATRPPPDAAGSAQP